MGTYIVDYSNPANHFEFKLSDGVKQVPDRY